MGQRIAGLLVEALESSQSSLHFLHAGKEARVSHSVPVASLLI